MNVEQLAVKAFDEARPRGSALWYEISDIARRSFIKATEYIVEETKKTVLSDHFAEVERVMGPRPNNLRDELTHAINRYSAENGSNTPDFILSEYLVDCLAAFDKAVGQRGKWCVGRSESPDHEKPR